MVDHEVARHERVHLRRIPAKTHHRTPHRGEVDDGRHAGEVLEDDPAGRERDLGVADTPGVVPRKRAHVVLGDHATVAMSQTGFEEDLDAVRETCDVSVLAESVEAADGPLSEWRGKAGAGTEQVRWHRARSPHSGFAVVRRVSVVTQSAKGTRSVDASSEQENRRSETAGEQIALSLLISCRLLSCSRFYAAA